MITLSRLYQITVIVVLAFALIMSSPGKEAKAWTRPARCPIAFSNALSHIGIAARGAGLDMQYCYVQGDEPGHEITIIGRDMEDDAAAVICMQLMPYAGYDDQTMGAYISQFQAAEDDDKELRMKSRSMDEDEYEACERKFKLIKWWRGIDDSPECLDELFAIDAGGGDDLTDQTMRQAAGTYRISCGVIGAAPAIRLNNLE